ncbi:single-stranded DNA-binding protein [Ornithinimicrobium ciconiae]|uniref:Single-stranded DNA-binding protein n=1 Tax=Ornithinimicrobium ciconiae TaxID=2594265 RepID=A0A516G6E5_9MICO|nr:single-stranded DNA-binding protein [Ornithinimicrobium ciconiae]QDO87097.1 single-stranded DNA-binding protein [Ornithinimicrobium ciconiae]
MAGDTQITVVGNLTADPELRFTPSGAAVANFTVASTPRTFDRQTNEWKDQETLFMRCSIWREAAENVAESLTRGTRVVVTGRLVARSWDTPEGDKRTVMEMQADEVGPSLKYATAKVTKAQRGSGGGGNWAGGQQGGGQQGGGQGGQQFAAPQGGQPAGGAPAAPQSGQQGGASQSETDPWATGGNAGGQQGGGWNSPSYDEPPF